MNSKQFFLIVGILLFVIGVIGFFGLIGPMANDSVFREAFYFNNIENWVNLGLGLAMIIISFSVPDRGLKWMSVIFGLFFVALGVYSIFSNNLFGAELQNPADTFFHLILGIWGLLTVVLVEESTQH